MSLPDWMIKQLAGGSVVIQPISFTMPSGIAFSGTHGHFISGVCADVSGNLADFSGATIDIVSGLRGSFSSGLVSPALSGLLSIQMSGAVSGRVLTSDTSGNVSWQPAPAGSVPDPIDNSGAMIDILSGISATFNSGISLVNISGTQARFSGEISNIISGVQAAFSSGIISVAISGLLGFQMSGALSGRVVTSNNAGVGTWQTPPAGGGGGTPNRAVVEVLMHMVSRAVWTNMPGAITELYGGTFNRTQYEPTGARYSRINVGVSVIGASANTRIGVQWSEDNGTTWKALNTGTVNDFPTSGWVSIGTSTGTKVDNIVELASGVNLGVRQFRFVGISGNATADPNIECKLYVMAS